MTAVLDKLGVGRVIAIGHSMGGEVATALVEADPSRIKRLVLIELAAEAGNDLQARHAACVDAPAYTAFRTAHNDSMAYETEKPGVERLAALNPVPPLLVIFGS